MPGEGPRPPTTPSPARLQLLREGATKAAERRLQIDNITFSTVTAGAFTPMKLTLASPFFLDHGSVFRVRQFFAAYNCNIQRYCRVTALHKCLNKERCDASSSTGDDSEKIFVAQLKMPIDARFGERLACGKAPTKREAIALACMHAELIVDALGLALYPSSREQQEAHVEECRKVNRWCAAPGDCDYHYTKASPPPLQLVKSAAGMTAAEADPTASLEAALVSHTKAINSFKNVTEVKVLVPSTRRDFVEYMTQHRTSAQDAGSPFFVEALGVKGHEVYRATVTVPVPVVTADSGTEGTATVDTNKAVFSSFVAIGIGTTEMEAEIAASMHVFSVLELLNRPVLGSAAHNDEGKSHRNLTCDTELPPPYRYVVAHLGRIMVPGLSPVRGIGFSPASEQRRGMASESQEARLRSARAELPRSDWSLDADAEGCIIVNPSVTAQEGRNYVHTLPSVRQADRFATVRLRDFLERHGKRLESAVTTAVVGTDEGLKRWVKKVFLPVPESFGCVEAHGEAYTEEEALIMCAVHAELLLDEIGVALYDLALLQAKHCDVARMLGRWAPYETKARRQVACIPPPVRKEHADSCLWARLSKESMKTPTNSLYEREKGSSPTTHAHKECDTTTTRVETGKTGTNNLTANTTATITASVGEKLTDDVLCDLAGLVPVHPSEFFRHAPRILDNYCKRKGVDVSRIMRQYNVSSPTYGFVHRAIMEIPLPQQFGRRYAVACASSKKDAFTLCCMHAVLTLGELGVPVYTGAKQAEYAAVAQSRGRYAPRPGDPLKPGNTKSPQGLKSLPEVRMEKPRAPSPPDRAACRKPFVWGSYVTACRGFIKQLEEQVVFDALFTQGRAPRSGVDVEDVGLDVVEALPLFANVKSKLPQKCAAAGLPPPPSMAFRFEVHGRPPHRRYLVEQPVLGTPYFARGMGAEGHEAVTRAAMHYEYIVGTTSSTQRGVGEAKTMIRQRQSDLFDAALRDFTPRGKLSIMTLYTTLRAPFVPLRLSLKERGGVTGTQTVFVSLVEMEDESGLRMAGKGEDRANAEEARNRAIAELYKQLQRKSAFQAVAQLVQTHPALRTEGAAHLVTEEKTLTALRLLLMEQKHVLSPPPLLQSPSEFLECAGAASLLRVGASHLNSTELRLLFDAVEHALGTATSASALTLPAGVRNLLSTMGLTVAGATVPGLKDNDVEVTTVGVVAAFFATCLPPLDVRKGLPHTTSGALPLQLAKLLLVGSLLNCQHLCIRVAALVLSSVNEDEDQECSGGDVLEFVARALPPGARRFASTIAARLEQLTTQLKEKVPPSSALAAFAAASHVSVDDNTWGTLQKEMTLSEHARLRLAIAFATFPKVLVQRKASVDNVLRLITVESKDQQRTERVVVPQALAESSGTSMPSTCSSCCYCTLPCFCAFDGATRHGGDAEKSPALGTFLPPCGLLLASALCDEPRMVTVADDVPNVALVDGFLPVVMRAPEFLTTLVELRLSLRWHWGVLRPMPAAVQSAVDELLLARHSLSHVAQATLLE
ncbi:hypothetical protein DQ04_01631000 [Trypanosoma grayi]|uniref:hypothetical protein n=1 Tax=Trypanosoma grayi TaxID=71804 RepID=UPI0004F41840|nr:hypothetical protein DQ04_01631000 [Trypanosoma grayi]KEG12534.1 hypothetical protein DQ04_01631000 [Trypanosoma grayi]